MGGGGGLSIHPWILYALLLLLSAYVATDLLTDRSWYGGGPADELSLRLLGGGRRTGGGGGAAELLPPPQSSSSPQVLSADSDDICKTVEGHMEEEEEEADGDGQGGAAEQKQLEAEDPWRQLKWVGKAARCRVKGHLIEKLDAGYNFRRGFALRLTRDVEDKTHLLPWMLGTKVDLNGRRRRILLDLGAAAFSSSVEWFLRMYPCDFTEIHAFEADESLLRLPEASAADEERQNYAPPNQWAEALKKPAALPAWMLPRLHLHHSFVSDFDDPATRALNITRFLKEELRPSPGLDALVVKMDIEGSEWDVLRRWLADPDMPLLVDELFVEVHYDHPSMRGYHWSRFAPTSRSHAFRFLAHLRHAGFFVHPWP